MAHRFMCAPCRYGAQWSHESVRIFLYVGTLTVCTHVLYCMLRCCCCCCCTLMAGTLAVAIYLFISYDYILAKYLII